MVMQDDPNSVDPLIDPLIDDVAREMTGARPADDLEGFVRRVSARIQSADAAAGRAPRTWVRGWVLALAAAAVLVLAVFVVRERNVLSKPDATAENVSRPTRETPLGLGTETASGLRDQGSGPAEVQPSALSPQPAALSPERSAGRARPSVLRAAAAAPGLSGDPDFQALTTAPIEMSSLDVSPLVVAMPIEISAIAIERIEIVAMP